MSSPVLAMSRGAVKRTSTLLSPSAPVAVYRTRRRCLTAPRRSTIFTASVSSSSRARCSSRFFSMMASAEGGPWATAPPALRNASTTTAATASPTGLRMMPFTSEKVLQEDEEAIVVPVAPPVRLGLAGEEVQAGLELEGISEAVRELGLDVAVGGGVEVEDGRQLELRVLAQLQQRAADERLPEDGAGDEIAQPRHRIEGQDLGARARVQRDLPRVLGHEDDLLDARQRRRVPRVVQPGDALPPVVAAVRLDETRGGLGVQLDAAVGRGDVH